ncbi:MAG: 23S rRNA (uracil(1939)-C(5))-methyltransferase RlmD [Ruminococcaceae bacterium]|nr:23S rRNA (uracil(1939)-C(5))-methyltransferase RlmD [Oscillospiraceae bacterium]
MNKNQTLTVRIESLTGKGVGIARCDGQVIFVPAVAQGDLCEIKIIKLTSSYAVAKLEKVIEYSPERIMNSCSAFPRCGGCSFRHVSYNEELHVKKQTVADALTRIGGLEVSVDDVVSTGETDNYRNKAQYPIGVKDGRIVFGFYSNHSHRIIPCDDCKIQPDIFNEIMRYATVFFNNNKLSAYDELTGNGLLRHCYLRINKSGGVMFCLVVNSNGFKYEKEFAEYLSKRKEIVSVFINFNQMNSNVILSDNFKCIYGNEYIEDEFFGLALRMSPDSFYQVNRKAAEILYKTAFDKLERKAFENVFDLYCGVGSIGLSLVKYAKENGISVKRVIGYEVVEKAIASAKQNAANNGIQNAEFYVGDLNSAPTRIMEEIPPSLVIVDPPRKGCSKELVDMFLELDVPYILYISCDPATLARDLKILSEKYNISSVTPVDLFPRTAHVECTTLLERK